MKGPSACGPFTACFVNCYYSVEFLTREEARDPGSTIFVTPSQSTLYCVGIEINANHIRGVREGYVTGVVQPLHLGSTTHVWDIKIYDEKEKLVCVSRLTVAILIRK